MAKTLLNGVNAVLKRTGKIDVTGELTSLTVEAKQTWIDISIQVWNEVMEQLYSKAEMPLPKILAENTIELTTSDRDYALQSDLVRFHFPLVDETNGRYIAEYAGGYLELVKDQPRPTNYTGLPMAGAIRPTDGQLYLDRIPTSSENGLVYKYRYEKDAALSAADDTFPFTDAVFRALTPAAAQLFRLEKEGRESYSGTVYRASMGRAARLLRNQPQSSSWKPRRATLNPTDPMNA